MTANMKAMLGYLVEREAAGELYPTFDEIAEHLSMRSKAQVHRTIEALEERGKIRRLPGRARAIVVVKGGDEYDRGYAAGVADERARQSREAA